jgi:hypothetical protein
MRLVEFVRSGDDDNSGHYPNVVTALSLLQKRIQAGDLKPEVPTELVIKYIRNTGLSSFTYQDLLAVNDAEPSMKNILKNITPESVTVAGADVQTVANEPDSVTPADAENPEQTVSNMAKQAVARRQ